MFIKEYKHALRSSLGVNDVSLGWMQGLGIYDLVQSVCTMSTLLRILAVMTTTYPILLFVLYCRYQRAHAVVYMYEPDVNQLRSDDTVGLPVPTDDRMHLRWQQVQRVLAKVSDYDFNQDSLLCSGPEVTAMPVEFAQFFPDFDRLRTEKANGRICKRFMQIECGLYRLPADTLEPISAVHGRNGSINVNRDHTYKFQGVEDFARRVAYPFVSSEGIESVANLVYHGHKSAVSQWSANDVRIGDIIVVRGLGVSDSFWDTVGSIIKVPYILVTQTEGENVLPGRHGDHVHDQNLHSWYIQNLDRTGGHTSPKLRAIPIGHLWRAQKADLWAAHRQAPPVLSTNRSQLAVVQFTNHNKVRTQALQAMTDIAGIEAEPYYSGPDPVGHMLAKYQNAQFVASPFGAGPDCHRTWEALTVGAVPIVQDHYGLNELFVDEPVLVIKDWKQITRETLAVFASEQAAQTSRNIFVWVWWDKLLAEQTAARIQYVFIE